MRLLIFLPDDQSFHAQREDALAKYPALTRIRLSELAGPDAAPEARRTALAQAMQSAGPKGFVILDPPETVDELADIDRLCLETFGKKRKSLPRAIFFAPRPPKKKQADPFEAYRATFKDRFHHYHKDRRSLTYEKPLEKPLKKTVKLAGKANSPIRWILLGPMALTCLAILLLLFLFRDVILHGATISTGETTFGARVDVGNLTTTLQPSLTLDSVQVADRSDPQQNLFEFERFGGDLVLADLFSGRLHMKQVELEGLAFQTPREESGALSGASRVGEEEEGKLAQFGNLLEGRLDGLVRQLLKKLEPPALDELRTVQVARELEQEATQRMERLEARLTENPALAGLAAARAELDALLAEPIPPAVERVQARVEALGALGSGAQLEGLEAELTQVGLIDFSGGDELIDEAKAELDAAEREVAVARSALESAVEIEKVDMRTLLKLPKIIKEVEGALDQLKDARERVTNARDLADRARADLVAKREAGDDQLAELRGSLDQLKSGGSGEDPDASLMEELEIARRELAGSQERASELLSQVQAGVAALSTEGDSLRTMLEEDRAFLSEGAERLRLAAEQDRDELLARYSLDSFDAEDIVEALVGDGIFEWIRPLWGVYEDVQPQIASRLDAATVRAAPRGVTYDFPGEAGEPGVMVEPGVWIEAASFTGSVDLDDEPFRLTGTGQDLSSSPRLLGRPAQIAFVAEGASLPERRLTGDLAFQPDGTLEARLDLAGFALDGLELGGDYAPESVSSDDLSATLVATFTPEGLRSTIDLRLGGMRLAAPASPDVDPRIASLLADAYRSFDLLEAKLELLVQDGELASMEVTSNVGDELQSMFDSALTQQVEEAQAAMQSELDGQLADAQGGALGSIESFGPQAESLLAMFTQDTQGAESAASEDVNRLQSLLSSLELPTLGGPHASDETVADLEQRLQQESARLASGADAQSGAIEALLGELVGTDEAAGSVDSALAEELRRLLKLR